MSLSYQIPSTSLKPDKSLYLYCACNDPWHVHCSSSQGGRNVFPRGLWSKRQWPGECGI